MSREDVSEAMGDVLSAVDKYGDVRVADAEEPLNANIVALKIRAEQLDKDLTAAQVTIDQLRVELDECRADDDCNTTPDYNPRDGFGVVTPFQIPDYADIDHVFDNLVRLGVKTIRGRYRSGGNGDEVMARCSALGIKWLPTLILEAWATDATSLMWSKTQLESRMRDMLDNPFANDVIIGLENCNEANNGGASNWATRCAEWADVMYMVRDELGFDFPILSPAMHDVRDDERDGGDWMKVATAGVDFDVASVHSYPKGRNASYMLPERLERLNAAFTDRPPVWLTEFGWMMSPDRVGPVYTSPADAANYLIDAPAELMDFGGQVKRFFLYELTDTDRGVLEYPEVDEAVRLITGVSVQSVS